jgi:Predicted SPOUT methyltransferase
MSHVGFSTHFCDEEWFSWQRQAEGVKMSTFFRSVQDDPKPGTLKAFFRFRQNVCFTRMVLGVLVGASLLHILSTVAGAAIIEAGSGRRHFGPAIKEKLYRSEFWPGLRRHRTEMQTAHLSTSKRLTSKSMYQASRQNANGGVTGFSCISCLSRYSLAALLHVTIRMVGRRSGDWIDQGCKVYETRLQPVVDLNVVYYKTNEGLIKNVESDYAKQVPVVLLDPTGKPSTSEQFMKDFYQRIETVGKAKLVYVIGGGT